MLASAINSSISSNEENTSSSDTKSSSSDDLELEDFTKPRMTKTASSSSKKCEYNWMSVGEFGWKIIFMLFQLSVICMLMAFCMYHLSVSELSEVRELVYWTTLMGCFGILMPTPLRIRNKKKQ